MADLAAMDGENIGDKMPRKTKVAQKPKSEPKQPVQAVSEPQTANVVATQAFYDMERDVNCDAGAMWETSRERALSLEERGCVRVIQ